MPVKVIYKTSAKATGGGREEGRAVSEDNKIDVKLSTPKEMGGSGGEGTNPEQLFASGYSACFLGAMHAVSKDVGVTVPQNASVEAEIGFGPRSQGGFGITADLTISLPGIGKEDGLRLINKAHEVCPYSNATRNNVNVGLRLA